MPLFSRHCLAPTRFTRTLLASTVAIAAALCVSAPAHAAITVVTYNGVIGMALDLTGMFGVVGAQHEGQAYSLVYTIDDTAVGAISTATSTMSQISGSGPTSPVHAALTINGITHTINGSQEGTAQQWDLIHASGQPSYGVSDKIRQTSTEYSVVGGDHYHSYTSETYVSSYDQDFVTSPDYHAHLTYPGNRSTDSIYNLVQFNDFDYRTNTQVNYSYFNLRIDNATVATAALPPITGAVPEPETWAMLLLGLAAVRGMTRSRRSIPG